MSRIFWNGSIRTLGSSIVPLQRIQDLMCQGALKTSQ
jgi:hypothetical protein